MNSSNKELKDYLHLYLGCEAAIGYNPQSNAGMQIDKIVGVYSVGATTSNGYMEDFANIKPILRPLSDMTEEEFKEVAAICYKSVYDSDPDFYHEEIVTDKEGGGFKWDEEGYNEKEWHYGLTVTNEGVDFSANGHFLKVPHYDTHHYLLSKHFDLFGLIESNIALDKTKLQP